MIVKPENTAIFNILISCSWCIDTLLILNTFFSLVSYILRKKLNNYPWGSIQIEYFLVRFNKIAFSIEWSSLGNSALMYDCISEASPRIVLIETVGENSRKFFLSIFFQDSTSFSFYALLYSQSRASIAPHKRMSPAVHFLLTSHSLELPTHVNFSDFNPSVNFEARVNLLSYNSLLVDSSFKVTSFSSIEISWILNFCLLSSSFEFNCSYFDSNACNSSVLSYKIFLFGSSLVSNSNYAIIIFKNS